MQVEKSQEEMQSQKSVLVEERDLIQQELLHLKDEHEKKDIQMDEIKKEV